MNAITHARETLNAHEPGLFERSIEFTLSSGGIMHVEPDCFILLLPEPDCENTWRVLFLSGSMRTAKRIARGLPPMHLLWRRDFTGRPHYGERTRPLTDFLRHPSPQE